MAIVNNTASEIGDVILINSSAPVFGILQLQSYTDILVGVTGTRFFDKEFSYSIDGIFFSDWIPLTDANLLAITIQPQDHFFINYKYTRQGTDLTGVLEWDDIFLNGTFLQPLCPNYYILPKSIFKDFFCYNPQHAALCSILTKKMWEKGIVPEYVTRNQTETPQVDDKDYLDFWSTTCCFFALQLMLGKRLEEFDSYLPALQDFLNQRDVIFCRDSTDIEDLKYIKSNYYDEIRKRGTLNIFNKKGENSAPINGEFLRMICYDNSCEEFFWELLTDERMGWCLGKSSPMYKGSSFSKQLIKGKEKVEDFQDLNNFDTYLVDGGVMSLILDSGMNVAKISAVPNGKVAGFSYDSSSIAPDMSKALVIDENVDYEITFQINQNINVDNITFGVHIFDCEGNQLSPKSAVDSTDSNFFFSKKKLNQPNKMYFVRGILYNKEMKILTSDEARLNIGYGNNLKSVAMAAKMIPYLVLDRTSNPDINGELKVWDFKVRPLVKGMVANTMYNDLTFLPTIDNVVSLGKFATCFLTTKNIMHIAFKNGNDNLTYEDLYKLTTDKLIPYNSQLLITKLVPENPPLSLDFDLLDFMIIKYRWFTSSGSDLDTRTFIEGTSSISVDDISVGYQRGDISIISGQEKRIVGTPSAPYIIWGGDGLNVYREEHILVDFKKLSIDFPLSTDIFSYMRAFWEDSKNTGKVELEFVPFLGGTMDYDGASFKNIGGLQGDILKITRTVNMKRNDFPTTPVVNIDGEDVGKIKYNTITKQAIYILP